MNPRIKAQPAGRGPLRVVALATAVAFVLAMAGDADAQRRKRKRRAPKPKPAPAAPADPGPAAKGDSGKGADGKPKKPPKLEFSGMDLEGRLRTPQLLYFLERASAELQAASLERRSFIPEMVRSLDEEEL